MITGVLFFVVSKKEREGRAMRYLWLLGLVLVLVSPVFARQEMRAEVGELQYPFVGKSDLVVWPDTSCTGGIRASYFGANITERTVINFVGRDLHRQNLDLLTGERVCAYGLVEITGEGEGTKEKFLSLTIVILPKQSN